MTGEGGAHAVQDIDSACYLMVGVGLAAARLRSWPVWAGLKASAES
jgi:hypothetical protein